MDARERVAEGMAVYTRDGEKLGKVVAADDGGLFVEKGFFFPREYGFRYDDVEDVLEDGVHLRLDREAVSRALVEDDGGVERTRPSAVSEERERPDPSARPPEEPRTGPPPSRHVEGRTIPMVGEGIAPMLVEEEVLVVEKDPSPAGERQAPPAGEPLRPPREPGGPARSARSKEDDHD